MHIFELNTEVDAADAAAAASVCCFLWLCYTNTQKGTGTLPIEAALYR